MPLHLTAALKTKITDAVDGVLILDKPAGWTSHDVVARVRRICDERSVGHLGTLDPMATGVLPLLLGKLTRLSQFFTLADKAYEGTIRFGFATDTYDAEGEKVGEESPADFTQAELEASLGRFRGMIEQVPPPFSAKKVDGVPAYKLARRREPVVLKRIRVEMKELTILGYDEVSGGLEFRAVVSSGAYIRSLAHDLGQAMGTGAHLAALRRTRVGGFHIAEAVTLEMLEEARASGTLGRYLLGTRGLLQEMPAVTANDEQLARIRHGNSVNLPEFSGAKRIRIYPPEGELAAIAERVAGTLFQPKIVLC